MRVLVTGAGQRVGAAIAKAFGAGGAHVAVHYHGSRDGAEEVCSSIEAVGGRAVPLRADLMDTGRVPALVERAVEALGGLDVLVASAGNYEHQDFGQITEADLDRSLALNLKAPLFLAQGARGALTASRGAIVLVTCTSPRAPYPDYASYTVSKGALCTLTKVLAVELAPHVRVNAVAPGTVLPPPGLSESALAEIVRATPLQRVGLAQDVADAVVYLATAPFVTGVELTVDGGRAIRGL